ncbi:class D sortase [Piscibacillus halophilus]|uniref:class D sortase n=1 Tax=Piscibacillus halophilus TaxID=571933 RepID=UPI00158B8750|nr:class D sortase [Piscibacillus halophilus]
MLNKISNLLIIVGVLLVCYFGYEWYFHHHSQKQSLADAEKLIDEFQDESVDHEVGPDEFDVDPLQAFGTLKIPKLDKTLAIIEGADEDSLAKGVGHMSETALPGQNEQIILSGHRDTVFRSFDQIEVGDTFIVELPYGTYEYKIMNTKIVSADDTSIVGEMGEEVLVVSTCYPFNYIGNAPERFVAYAYPVN